MGRHTWLGRHTLLGRHGGTLRLTGMSGLRRSPIQHHRRVAEHMAARFRCTRDNSRLRLLKIQFDADLGPQEELKSARRQVDRLVGRNPRGQRIRWKTNVDAVFAVQIANAELSLNFLDNGVKIREPAILDVEIVERVSSNANGHGVQTTFRKLRIVHHERSQDEDGCHALSLAARYHPAKVRGLRRSFEGLKET